MLKKNGPGGCCCCPNRTCLKYSWETDDSPIQDLSAFSQVSGTWTVDTWLATLTDTIQTADDNAILIYDSNIAADNKIIVYFLGDLGAIGGSTQTWRAIVGWKDSSNYAYAEFRYVNNGSYPVQVNAVYVRLGEVIGGVDTYLTAESADGGSDASCTIGLGKVGVTASVCLNSGVITSVKGQLAATVSDPSALGQKVGLKTISSTTGVYDFCKVYAYYQYSDCLGCYCASCQPEKTPESVSAEFDGVASGACGDPEAFNSSAFILDRTAFTTCRWSYGYFEICGGSYKAILYLDLACTDIGDKTGSFTATFRVQILGNPTGGTKQATYFRATIAETCCPSDCIALIENGLTFSHVSDTGYPTVLYDFSGATLTLANSP